MGCENICVSESDGMQRYVLGLADRAWSELLKEKIKQHYEKTQGERLGKIAQISAEANIAYWEGQLENETQWEALQEKLRKALHS